MPYVVVQDDGGFAPLAEWSQGGPYLPEVADPDNISRWMELSRELVARALAAEVPQEINIFLIVDEEELFDQRDRNELVRLLECIRDFAWGARTFLVASLIKLSRGLESGKADLTEWMNRAVSYRVADFLQLTGALGTNQPEVLWTSLRDAAARSRARWERLRTADSTPWRCMMEYRRHSLLADLLEPMVTNDTAMLGDSNLLIAVSSKEAAAQVDTVERSTATWYGRTCQVVTVGRQATNELKDYCEQHGLRPPLNLQGILELWYCLLRLNRGVSSWHPADRCLVKSLSLEQPPLLMRRAPFPRPYLLLTSNFAPAEDDQWLEAAKDVGEMVVRLPFDLSFHLGLAVDPTRLMRVLEAHPSIDTWIHIGHGSGMSGLWIPGEGDISSQRWVKCFAGRVLRLALFLTCDSHEISRSFAAAGAELSIGFEGKVEAAKTRELAIDIIKALAMGSHDSEATMAALRAGIPHFEAAHTRQATVHAYRPRH
jgi:hypothetical protein